MADLGTLGNVAGFSGATATNADGSVVVGRSYGVADEQGFRWTSAGMISLGARSNLGADVSDDGAIVVGFTENIGNNDPAHRFSATRWTAATGIVPIGDIWLGDVNTARPSPYISPRISGDGSVVVGVISGTHPQAARYLSGGRVIPLGSSKLGTLNGPGFAGSAWVSNGLWATPR